MLGERMSSKAERRSSSKLFVEGIIREFVAAHDSGFTSWRLEAVMNRFKQKFAQIESAPQKQEMEFDEVEALMNYHNLKTLRSCTLLTIQEAILTRMMSTETQ